MLLVTVLSVTLLRESLTVVKVLLVTFCLAGVTMVISSTYLTYVVLFTKPSASRLPDIDGYYAGGIEKCPLAVNGSHWQDQSLEGIPVTQSGDFVNSTGKQRGIRSYKLTTGNPYSK